MTKADQSTEVAVRDQETRSQTSDAMLVMIERLVRDESVPIERLREMVALRQEIEDRDRRLAKEDSAERAVLAYSAAMADCQAELKPVVKNQYNQQTKSHYADLAAISTVADPIIHKHGFSVSFWPVSVSEVGAVTIGYRVAHKGGHVVTGQAEVPSSMKGAKGGDVMTGTHSFGSGMTYGRRYLKLALFDISTEDDDDGNKAGARQSPDNEPITREQFDGLRELLDSDCLDEDEEDKLLRWLRVDSLNLMTQGQAKRGLNALRDKVSKRNGRTDA